MNKDKSCPLLIVEDDEPLRDSCVRLFERHNYHVTAVPSGQEALHELEQGPEMGVVLADLKMPGMDGIELLREIRQRFPEIEVILMTAYGTIKSAVEALKLGAADYVTKPFDPEELARIVNRAQEMVTLRMKVRNLTREIEHCCGPSSLIGSSKAMQGVYERIKVASTTPVPVLIYGETGTGKELVARAIHDSSKKSRGPFVAINCAAFAPELIDRELFGHTKGAFTGADRDKPGLFSEAAQGTLFLDEIAEMTLEAQARLLRAIENGRIRPVGHTKEIEASPRIISATNRDPLAAVESKRLRQDLYYRLKVIEIAVPPLRDRKEDIPLLSHHFLTDASHRMGKEIEGFEDRALTMLMSHPWPGNVRELKNLLEGVVASVPGNRIEGTTIQAFLQHTGSIKQAVGPLESEIPTLDAMARSLAERAVRELGGNKSKAARAMGVSRKKLYDLLGEPPPPNLT